MFSVIIPLYNKSAYVAQAVASVLQQSYREFELIIVDDGSTDDSLATVQGMDMAGCEVEIVCQRNSGVSAARNEGVRRARYDNIAFLDADDWWEPDFLEEMKALLDKYPQAGIYGSGYYLVKHGKKRVAPIGVASDFEDGEIDYCRVYAETLCMPLWTGAVVMPRKVFLEMDGFKPGLKLGEDFDLWIRIALKYPVVLLNKQLSNYNQDVELQHRAVGKLHDTNSHMLWNLSYLEEQEKSNPNLKCLLDRLRVYALYPYYLNRPTRQAAREELAKVSWNDQPRQTRRKYKFPIPLLLLDAFVRRKASWLKQKIKERR